MRNVREQQNRNWGVLRKCCEEKKPMGNGSLKKAVKVHGQKLIRRKYQVSRNRMFLEK